MQAGDAGEVGPEAPTHPIGDLAGRRGAGGWCATLEGRKEGRAGGRRRGQWLHSRSPPNTYFEHFQVRRFSSAVEHLIADQAVPSSILGASFLPVFALFSSPVSTAFLPNGLLCDRARPGTGRRVRAGARILPPGRGAAQLPVWREGGAHREQDVLHQDPAALRVLLASVLQAGNARGRGREPGGGALRRLARKLSLFCAWPRRTRSTAGARSPLGGGRGRSCRGARPGPVGPRLGGAGTGMAAGAGCVLSGAAARALDLAQRPAPPVAPLLQCRALV